MKNQKYSLKIKVGDSTMYVVKDLKNIYFVPKWLRRQPYVFVPDPEYPDEPLMSDEELDEMICEIFD
jgi:hypothetical protein